MFAAIKAKLLQNNGEHIVALLDAFNFEKIQHKLTEIRFARNLEGGLNISIRLQDNENLLVKDFAHGDRCMDIFAYISQEKGVPLRTVLHETRQILGLNEKWTPAVKQSLFGGIYDNLSHNTTIEVSFVYSEDILNQYADNGNFRFLNDGVSLESQKFWGVRFDVETNRIVIPIYDELYRLVGVKSRYNGVPDELNLKYYYDYPCRMSQVVYGYAQNYSYLYGNDVIITEAEKSPQQAYSFDVRNVVALGSNNLSPRQAQLLTQLEPKRIILALDEGLELSKTQRNAEILMPYLRLKNTEIWYWDSTIDIDIPFKASPTDMGEAKFNEIMNEQLVRLH